MNDYDYGIVTFEATIPSVVSIVQIKLRVVLVTPA